MAFKSFCGKKDFFPPMLGMKGDTGEPSSLKNNVFDHAGHQK